MATSAERPSFPRRRLITGALPRRGSARNRPSGPGPHFESARGDRLSPSTSKEPATVISLAPTARSSIGKQLGLDAAKYRADGRGLIGAGQLAVGWVSFEIGGAIELFDEEVRHNPDDAGPYLKLGRFLYDIGYSKKAIVVLREAQRFRLDDEVGQEVEAAIEDCLNSAHDEEAEERSNSRAAVDNPDNAEWQHAPAATRDKTGNLPAVTANDRQAAPDLGIEARVNQG